MPLCLRTLACALLGLAAAQAQLALPAFQRSYVAPAHARGFCFQAPLAFSVTGLQVPDESEQGTQTVALYRLAQKPPRYFASVLAAPIYFATGKSREILKPTRPLRFAKGEWLVVLGSCGGSSTQVSSYGANLSQSSVLGHRVTLERVFLQKNLPASKGIGQLSSNGSNPLARVRVFVEGGARADAYGQGSGYLPLPTLAPIDTAPPRLGQRAGLRVTALRPREPFGVLLIASGRDQVATPLGKILVKAPLLDLQLLPTTIPQKGMTLSLALPKAPALAGMRVNLQLLAVRDPDYALSNGLEWRLGL